MSHQPSRLLHAIAKRLRQELQPTALEQNTEDAQPVDVRVTDHMLDDVTEVVTFRAPAVILSATGLGEANRALGDLTVAPMFVARCYTRLPRGPSRPEESASDGAMDLAALVALIVEDAIWADDENKPIAYERAQNVRVQNRTVSTIAERGHAMWTVSWNQRVGLRAKEKSALLHAFKRLHVEIAMGDADTPDPALTLELEGGTP